MNLDLLAYGCTESMPELASDQQYGADSTDDQLKERLVMMARQGARRPDSDYMRRVQANDDPATAESITPIFRRRIVEWMLAVFSFRTITLRLVKLIPRPPSAGPNLKRGGGNRRRSHGPLLFQAALLTACRQADCRGMSLHRIEASRYPSHWHGTYVQRTCVPAA
jgi:hypothetical protein